LTIGYTKFKYEMILSNELYDYQALEQKDYINKNMKKKKGNHHDDKSSTIDRSPQSSRFPSILTFRRNKTVPEVPSPTIAATKTVKDYFDNLTAIKRILPFDELAYVKSAFKSLFSKYDPEEVLAKKGRAQVMRDLDVIKVIEKLQEIDKLKLLLLNKYQREAFDFIEKPLITLENQRPIHRAASLIQQNQLNMEGTEGQPLSVFHAREEFKSYSKFTKLYAAYRHLETDDEPRNKAYNKRLLDMLGENLVKVFKHVDQAMGEYPDPKRFEETVGQLLHDPIPIMTPLHERDNDHEHERSVSLDISKQNLLDISKQLEPHDRVE